MELTVALVISIIGVIISVCSFVLGRKDKSNMEVHKNSYNQGKTDQLLTDIMEKLDKIEKKLTTYEDEFETKTKKIVKEELHKHTLEYHHK